MKHKYGDKVIIKKDLNESRFLEELDVVPEMIQHAGKEAIIMEVKDDCYKLDIDNENWSWTDNMFEEAKIRGFEVIKDELRKHKDIEIQLPTRGSKHSIAYDLYSPIDIEIEPMKNKLIWTDVKAYFQTNEALIMNVRSSMGSHPVIMANAQGWIESDYYNNIKNDGNLGVNLLNLSTEPYIIKKGDRIAQCMFIPYLESDNCNTDEVRVGGHGSTGK